MTQCVCFQSVPASKSPQNVTQQIEVEEEDGVRRIDPNACAAILMAEPDSNNAGLERDARDASEDREESDADPNNVA